MTYPTPPFLTLIFAGGSGQGQAGGSAAPPAQPLNLTASLCVTHPLPLPASLTSCLSLPTQEALAKSRLEAAQHRQPSRTASRSLLGPNPDGDRLSPRRGVSIADLSVAAPSECTWVGVLSGAQPRRGPAPAESASRLVAPFALSAVWKGGDVLGRVSPRYRGDTLHNRRRRCHAAEMTSLADRRQRWAPRVGACDTRSTEWVHVTPEAPSGCM